MRQVERRGGWRGFQYFPSDSASTTNQTQTRNTNTHAVAHRLKRAIPELLKAFAPSTAPRPLLPHRRTKGCSVVYPAHCQTGCFVPQQGFLQPGMQITNIWRPVNTLHFLKWHPRCLKCATPGRRLPLIRLSS